MAITLLYHDVVDGDRYESSGFPGAGAARYKLTRTEFMEHLRHIAGACRQRPVTVRELPGQTHSEPRAIFTFDDGGVSSEAAAEMLESHGWRGHFFVTSDFIGSPTFVSASQIRALHERGHVIGSHSCSHPPCMSSCTWEQLLREWRQSCAVLSDILGAPVTTASVPCGGYSTNVARAAAQAGIQVLFNSEPTTRQRQVDGCTVLGRYTVYRGMSARKGAALAAGRLGARLRQSLAWNIKKVAKAIGGRAYLSLRERLLRRAYAHPRPFAVDREMNV